ncbi:hypothetical protein [Sulfobacillus harzensis]|uniref:Uncharacterized protein n=1 Tax=Sulfobacillus harzensis TaxID=2729629 RepID=A0A7Y0L2P5_9FIRM|nr:hypothetical protein [Sulfobacillus harzensis]NMP22191.1 hypothetical protein [Sulfobacillus harzensis]
MDHSILAKVVGARRAVITLITAILGLLVAFGVPMTAKQEDVVLSVIGLIFSYLAGDAYVQGKHVQASAVVEASKTAAAKPAAASSGS